MCCFWGYAIRIYIIAAIVILQLIPHAVVIVFMYKSLECQYIPQRTNLVYMFGYLTYFYRNECVDMSKMKFPPGLLSPGPDEMHYYRTYPTSTLSGKPPHWTFQTQRATHPAGRKKRKIGHMVLDEQNLTTSPYKSKNIEMFKNRFKKRKEEDVGVWNDLYPNEAIKKLAQEILLGRSGKIPKIVNEIMQYRKHQARPVALPLQNTVLNRQPASFPIKKPKFQKASSPKIDMEDIFHPQQRRSVDITVGLNRWLWNKSRELEPEEIFLGSKVPKDPKVFPRKFLPQLPKLRTFNIRTTTETPRLRTFSIGTTTDTTSSSTRPQPSKPFHITVGLDQSWDKDVDIFLKARPPLSKKVPKYTRKPYRGPILPRLRTFGRNPTTKPTTTEPVFEPTLEPISEPTGESPITSQSRSLPKLRTFGWELLTDSPEDAVLLEPPPKGVAWPQVPFLRPETPLETPAKDLARPQVPFLRPETPLEPPPKGLATPQVELRTLVTEPTEPTEEAVSLEPPPRGLARPQVPFLRQFQAYNMINNLLKGVLYDKDWLNPLFWDLDKVEWLLSMLDPINWIVYFMKIRDGEIPDKSLISMLTQPPYVTWADWAEFKALKEPRATGTVSTGTVTTGTVTTGTVATGTVRTGTVRTGPTTSSEKTPWTKTPPLTMGLRPYNDWWDWLGVSKSVKIPDSIHSGIHNKSYGIEWPDESPNVPWVYDWVYAYMIVDLLWLIATILLIIGGCVKIRGPCSVFLYTPFILVTLCIVVMDIVCAFYFGTTIPPCQEFWSFMHHIGVLNIDQLQESKKIWFPDYHKTYAHAPILITIFFIRGIWLWLLNIIFLFKVMHILQRVIGQRAVDREICFKAADPRYSPPRTRKSRKKSKRKKKRHSGRQQCPQARQFMSASSIPNPMQRVASTPPYNPNYMQSPQGSMNAMNANYQQPCMPCIPINSMSFNPVEYAPSSSFQQCFQLMPKSPDN